MDIGRFLSQINERHGTTFHLLRRYAEGENEGAYALADAAGVRYVLKRYEHEQIVPRLERARTITAYLRSKGAPVPIYQSVGTLPDGPTYAILSALPGSPSRALTNDQLQRLLALNDLQAGQAISHEQNWSSYATAVVFDGESGWADSLRTYSQATRSLLNSLQRLVMGKEACCAKTDDIVHGDLSPGNVLVEEAASAGLWTGMRLAAAIAPSTWPRYCITCTTMAPSVNGCATASLNYRAMILCASIWPTTSWLSSTGRFITISRQMSTTL